MTQLVAVRVSRNDVAALREEFVEAGQVSTVSYDERTEILTPHGLRLMEKNLGMAHTLDLLCKNADESGWPSVIETPPQLYKVTDCAGLIVRPSFFTFSNCLWWVEREGAFLISHFGQGAHFGFMPELYGLEEVRID